MWANVSRCGVLSVVKCLRVSGQVWVGVSKCVSECLSVGRRDEV